MDAALQADLGRAALPRLLAAAHDLLHRDEIGGSAEVPRELALGERTEAAAEVADVRVLDVPRDDVADLVAADFAPESIGGRVDALALRTARLEQSRQLVLPELLPGEAVRRRVTADDEGNRPGLARRPAILAREPHRVSRTQH